MLCEEMDSNYGFLLTWLVTSQSQELYAVLHAGWIADCAIRTHEGYISC